MSLRKTTPCDYGSCPYDAEYSNACEYWCGADEPEDIPEEYGYEEDPTREGTFVIANDGNEIDNVTVYRHGVNDYSCCFSKGDYSVRGTFLDVVMEIANVCDGTKGN